MARMAADGDVLTAPADLGAEARSRRRWRMRLVWAAILVVFCVATLYWTRDFLFGTPVAVYVSQRDDLAQSVVATGRVITPARISVASDTVGRVAQVPVAEGARVAAGEVLVVLDEREARATLDQAQAVVDETQARLLALRHLDFPAAQQDREQARAAADLARRRLRRIELLRTQGFVSEAEVDDARNAAEIADSRLRSADLAVAAKRSSGSDERIAQAELARGRSALAAAQTNLDRKRIRAPNAGILVTRSVEAGDVVQPGEELMTLSADGETRLVVAIDEKSLALLAEGQSALASADAFPDRRFNARLYYLNPGVDALRGAVEVKLRVDDPPAYLRQDMTVSVDIRVADRRQVVVLPADAVRQDARGTFVLALQEGRVVRRDVRVGIRGQGRTEIVQGLNAGVAVIPPSAGARIAPGQRARAVR